MKSYCLPFSQIPHTTRLFTDFLAYAPKVQSFYPRSPHFTEWLNDESRGLSYDAKRRERVATLLERQNKSWGASPKTLENMAGLRAGASAVVTGQQVGLFGGPLFSIFKALTAVKLANEATAAGVDCVPVFWLATSDHDLAEINHVSIPQGDGSLQKLEATTHGLPDAPVGTVTFGEEIDSLVNTAAELLGDSEVVGLLRQAYRSGETFGSAFARLFTKLFADWGVILLDGSNAELHAIAEPMYRAAIERSAELDDAVLARGQELEAAGYHQQVKVTESSTLLFTLHDGARVPVYRRGNRDSSDVNFAVKGALGIQLKLRLDANNKLIGNFEQGGNGAPAMLQKTGPPQVEYPPRNTPVAKELEGEWKGDYEMLGYTRHVSIKFANHPDGATAEFVIVGRKHNVLPVDLVTQEDDLVTVDSHEMGFTFEGRLRDGKLTGAIRQAAIETQLVLVRAK